MENKKEKIKSQAKAREKNSKNIINISETEFNQNKGITLVALVVTIVVLIILAMISINAVIGENGLIKKAQQAKELYKNAEIQDQEALNQLLGEYENTLNENGESSSEGNTLDTEPSKFELTVNYWYEEVGGVQAATSWTNIYEAGIEYKVDSPPITGYHPDFEVVTGVMPEKNVKVDVIYTRNLYTLTVHYRYANGGTVAAEDAVVSNLGYGDSYNVTSPTITGFIANRSSVSGVMPENDVVLTVFYTPVSM